jgi:hypothetical protein
MTERLSTLLHDEATALDVPPPTTAEILTRGHGLKRRRRATYGAVGLALAAVVTTGVVLGTGGDGPSRASDLPAASTAELEGWAAASGSTVELGNGTTVRVDGTVKSVYYTSAGVLVRTGAEATTDAADSTYTLIDADGRTTDFSLDLGDRVPGTDPTQPYLAYAEPTGRPDAWNVVVRDVRTGEILATVPIDGEFTWGGWVAPPVALSGSHLYVGMDDATLDVSWAQGTVEPSSVLPPSRMPTVAGGREVLEERNGAARVVDVTTGEVLLRSDDPDLLLSLSPDGRHAIAVPWRTCDESGECVYDKPSAVVYGIESGQQIAIDVRDGSYGWTPNGDLLRVDADSVDVCDPDTNVCHSTPVRVDGRDLRLGGVTYES